MLTTLAFIIGFALIDELTPTEQNSLGNWLMLVAQTLCTNGSENFRREWKGSFPNKYSEKNSKETNRDYTLRILNKTKEVLEKQIKNI